MGRWFCDCDIQTTQVGLKYVPTTAQVKRLVELMGDEYMSMKEIMELFDLFPTPKREEPWQMKRLGMTSSASSDIIKISIRRLLQRSLIYLFK